MKTSAAKILNGVPAFALSPSTPLRRGLSKGAAPSCRQRGETLIGLMIGLAVGLIVLAGASAMFVSNIGSNRETLQAGLLDREMKAIRDVMVSEIRRAQYRANSEHRYDGGGFCTDDFCNPADAKAFSLTSGTNFQFAFDRNEDGARNEDECTGFRLVNNAIEMKSGCNNPTWSQLSDPATVQITALSFTVNCGTTTGAAFYNRTVNITLTGRLVSDNTVTRTFTEQVLLRNPIRLSARPGYCPIL